MSEKSYPNITVVDENDVVITYLQLFDAIKAGYIRRAATVLIFNSHGEILLQRRSATVLEPNLLDYSAGGHVDEGESYEAAAKRELQEELGITVESLELTVPTFRTLRFFTTVYTVTLDDNSKLNPNNEEVSELLWLPLAEFASKIESNPELFTASLVEAWPHFRDKLTV